MSQSQSPSIEQQATAVSPPQRSPSPPAEARESPVLPPAKRPRFFKDHPVYGSNTTENNASPVPESVDLPESSEPSTEVPTQDEPTSETAAKEKEFRDQLQSIVGPLTDSQCVVLHQQTSGNVAEAVNVYFDEFANKPDAQPAAPTNAQATSIQSVSTTTITSSIDPEAPAAAQTTASHHTKTACQEKRLFRDWQKRYLGSLQAEVYATRSGRNLAVYDEKLVVLREPAPTGAARKSLNTVRVSNKDDSIMRIANSKGVDIARVPEQLAKYLSVLIDTKMCHFEGICIYAPETLRIGDYVVVQIDCFVLRSAFASLDIVPESIRNKTGVREVDEHAGKHYDDMSSASGAPGFFNALHETADEKIMRLRQQGLVYLFSQLSLDCEQSETTKKLGDTKTLFESLTKAGELDVPKEKSGSNDDSEEGGEETVEFSGDQMEAIYKRSSQMQDSHLKEVEPPRETFNMDLRPYQKRGLNWLLQREAPESSTASPKSTPSPEYREPMHPLWQEFKWPHQPKDKAPGGTGELDSHDGFYGNLYNGELSTTFPRQKKSVMGGILADEMGLGKTISTMALVHSNRFDPATEYDSTQSSMQLRAKRDARSDYAKYTTLVVAPMSLLSQWESEAYSASKPGSTRVLVYYGLTASSVNLRKLLCGPDAEKKAPHVVITSYGTLVSEHNQLINFRHKHKIHEDDWQDSLDLGLFGLFSVEFYRVVLDEGHTIKNRATKAAKACYNIRADRRWVLTGTPIINKLEDLFSLIKYLRVEPWNNFSFWKTFITVPFMTKDFAKAVNVVQSVMEPLMLRRTKDMKQADGTPLVSLPEKIISIERIKLSADEQQLYEWIFFKAQSAFNDSLSRGTAMKSYSTIMTQILRLRQACNHPSMVTKALIATQKLTDGPANGSKSTRTDGSLVIDSILDTSLQELVQRIEHNTGGSTPQESDARSYGQEVIESILKGADSECPICMTERIPLDDQAVTECWHMACLPCLTSHIQFQLDKGESPRCHMCREAVSMDKIYLVRRYPGDHVGEGPRIKLKRYNPAGQSTKVRALLGHLKATRTTSPDTKSVVFSQFTEFLDIIQNELVSEGFKCLRFDGTMSQTERAKVLDEFKAPRSLSSQPHNQIPHSVVMLISLKAGGVGLNLVSASQVFMMDPWWSYAVEAQAIDRIHRMGQTQAVKVVRFIVDGSVEERILKIQDRKKFLASTLGMSEEEKKQQRLEDFKAIFE